MAKKWVNPIAIVGSVPHTGGRSQGGRNQGVFVELIMLTDVGLLVTDVGPVPL